MKNTTLFVARSKDNNKVVAVRLTEEEINKFDDCNTYELEPTVEEWSMCMWLPAWCVAFTIENIFADYGIPVSRELVASDKVIYTIKLDDGEIELEFVHESSLHESSFNWDVYLDGDYMGAYGWGVCSVYPIELLVFGLLTC